MAIRLKDGAEQLARSPATELTFRYEPLTGTNQIYDVEFCANSVVLVTGTNGGTSTYHLNYVHVGQDFRLMKTNARHLSPCERWPAKLTWWMCGDWNPAVHFLR